MKRSQVFGIFMSVLLVLLTVMPANAVLVDGRDWEQPGDYLNLSYNDLSTIFDTATGRLIDPSDSVLGGYDFTGLVWAGEEEVRSMFNSYAGLTITAFGNADGPLDSTWAPAILTDFAPTNLPYGANELFGLTRNLHPSNSTYAIVGQILDRDPAVFITGYDSASLAAVRSLDDSSDPYTGVWLYKDTSSVPAPGTLILLTSGLLGVTALRRKR